MWPHSFHGLAYVMKKLTSWELRRSVILWHSEVWNWSWELLSRSKAALAQTLLVSPGQPGAIPMAVTPWASMTSLTASLTVRFSIQILVFSQCRITLIYFLFIPINYLWLLSLYFLPSLSLHPFLPLISHLCMIRNGIIVSRPPRHGVSVLLLYDGAWTLPCHLLRYSPSSCSFDVRALCTLWIGWKPDMSTVIMSSPLHEECCAVAWIEGCLLWALCYDCTLNRIFSALKAALTLCTIREGS